MAEPTQQNPEDQKYLCKPRDMNYSLEQARACGHVYGENYCRLGGKCSVLDLYFRALPKDPEQTPLSDIKPKTEAEIRGETIAMQNMLHNIGKGYHKL